MRLAIWSRASSIVSTVAAVVATVAFMPVPARAQAVAKPKPRVVSPNELKRLDAKLEDLRESFLRDTTTLIKGYEEAGQPERARVLLEALGRLDPKNELIKQKLAELQQTILAAREFELEFDPSKPWQPVGTVVKDEMLRIRVTGEYTCSLELAAGPDGLPTGNPADDIVGHVPLGAMMAVIASGIAEKDGKAPKPFVVGTEYEKPAERSGLLFLKVNLPPKSECKGKLTVRISGATRPQ